jgi:hypothetical protein
MIDGIVYIRAIQEGRRVLEVPPMTCSQPDCKMKLVRVQVRDRRPRPAAVRQRSAGTLIFPAVDPGFLLSQERVPPIASATSLAIMNPPPRKARKTTQATLAFHRTQTYQITPETDSPEPATRPKRCISPSSSTSNPSALASTPIPSTEGDDDDDEEEETDTKNSVLALL